MLRGRFRPVPNECQTSDKVHRLPGRRNMKIAILIARILLGLIFLVFGLNPFLHFLPAILPPGLAGQFLSVLIESHYVLFIGAIQLIGGALLLVNRYVPFALTL